MPVVVYRLNRLPNRTSRSPSLWPPSSDIGCSLAGVPTTPSRGEVAKSVVAAADHIWSPIQSPSWPTPVRSWLTESRTTLSRCQPRSRVRVLSSLEQKPCEMPSLICRSGSLLPHLSHTAHSSPFWIGVCTHWFASSHRLVTQWIGVISIRILGAIPIGGLLAPEGIVGEKTKEKYSAGCWLVSRFFLPTEWPLGSWDSVSGGRVRFRWNQQWPCT